MSPHEKPVSADPRTSVPPSARATEPVKTVALFEGSSRLGVLISAPFEIRKDDLRVRDRRLGRTRRIPSS